METDVKTDMINDLMDLILIYRQGDLDNIQIKGPKGAILYLKNLGYDVDENTITNLLDDPAFDDVIERSDDKIITLKTAEPEGTVAPDELEKSQEKVDKTAAKVATDAVKSGDKL
jgi:hypothetical protein